jgi:murein DD-endopeptidase MepM/ murein hydrolase activator NlpD
MSDRRGGLLRRAVDRVRSRYSVMVLAGPGRRLHHFTLPVLLIPVGIALVTLGLMGGGLVLLGWASDRVDQAHLTLLQLENERLLAQIEEMELSADRFAERLDEMAEVEREFRHLASLDPIPEEVRRLGIGGPPALSELADEASPSPTVREARETLDRLGELNRQALFQNANFREIVSSLENSHEELAHIPSISPVRRGWISSRYGKRTDPFTGSLAMHRGVDFSAWAGTPIYATADGRVRRTGRSGHFGLTVEIDHGNGILTRYAHCSRILVKAGLRVKRGDVIAEVGSTGRSTSPHCHYEVHVNGQHVNPLRYVLDGGPRVSNPA